MKAMEELRFLYELLGVARTEAAILYTKKTIRRKLAALPCDPLQNSLGEEWRKRIAEDGESWVKYCIMADEGESDEEINEFCAELEIHNHSQYDCTGKPFTMSIRWRRCACGIVFIHHIGLDV